jgi:hypothetical protein
MPATAVTGAGSAVGTAGLWVTPKKNLPARHRIFFGTRGVLEVEERGTIGVFGYGGCAQSQIDKERG